MYIDKMILNFIQKSKGPIIANTVLKERNKVKVTQNKPYNITSVIKCGIGKMVNGLATPEMGPHSQL
jgi:hypothetical protein